jgi:hypothetical protein
MAHIVLFKTAAEGARFLPDDFNQNMTDIEGAVNTAQDDIDALEAGRVKNTTDETIAGIKTFSSSPLVPTPTTATQAANKDYVDTAATPVAHVGSGGDAHADVVAGGADGFMTGADKTKLDNIATGAEVNQNAFSHVAVTGQVTLDADTKTDTFTFKPGTNITITTDPTTGEITINATGVLGSAASDVTLADAGGHYSSADVEGALNEVADAMALKAPLSSPALTDTPTTPTAAVDTDTTQIASTAFVVGQASATTPLTDGVAAIGSSKKFARADHVHPSDTGTAIAMAMIFGL